MSRKWKNACGLCSVYSSFESKYESSRYWSDEDKIVPVKVPELPGCMARGKTPEKALLNAKKAIQLWIDTAKEFGDPVPQPKGHRLMLA